MNIINSKNLVYYYFLTNMVLFIIFTIIINGLYFKNHILFDYIYDIFSYLFLNILPDYYWIYDKNSFSLMFIIALNTTVIGYCSFIYFCNRKNQQLKINQNV